MQCWGTSKYEARLADWTASLKEQLSEECTCARVSGVTQRARRLSQLRVDPGGADQQERAREMDVASYEGDFTWIRNTLGYSLRTKSSSTGSGSGQTSLSLVRLETFTKAEAGISNLSRVLISSDTLSC